MSWPWSQLGLPGPSGLPEIRRAYAEKLKTTHPEDDPEGFQRLHSAYQLASRMARRQKRQEDGQPPQPLPEQPPEQADFEKLPQGGAKPLRPAGEEEKDWDFEGLLAKDETPPRPVREDEKQDWDYDRLFAEGEAERAEERRRRGEERRRTAEFVAKGQKTGREERPYQEEDRWRSTETVLHVIEMMHSAQVEKEVWEKFFLSPQFRRAMESVDLIFGLEDFVSARNPSKEMRIALFTACGFDKGVSRPELRPLYQMLLPAWNLEKRKKQKDLFLTILAVPITVIVLVCAGAVLVSGWALSLAVLGLGLLFGMARGLRKRRPKSLKKERKFSAYTTAFAACCVIAAVFIIQGLVELFPGQSSAVDPREQVCRYLEEDFGEEFRSVYNKNAPDERYSNVFAQEADPTKQFMAGPDGVRNIKNGQYGYTTNYPEMKMLWALKDFAASHDITGVDNADRSQGLERWDTSGTFLITLPFYGAGDTITALGNLLEELSQEGWYQFRTPDCELVLCGRPMKAGRLVINRSRLADGGFDAEGVRTLYESSFAHAYCAQLLKELELDRDFIRGGGELYTLTGEGMAEMKGETCCKICGLDSEGGAALEYYVNVSGTAVYCVPDGFWASGGSEEQISFYRVLHRKDANDNPTGIVSLFYPWLKAG